MVINHNISALNTYNQLSKNEKSTESSLAKLSSGLRINGAADDAAGLAISQKMQAQINGLDQASSNAQDGISMLQTAEGALSETQSILQRMNTLAVQASNDTETDTDRNKIQDEMNQLAQEITRISNDTEFNSKNLLAGDFQNDTFQIGANAGQSIQVSIGAMDAKTLGVAADRNYLGTVGGTAGMTTSNIGTLGKGLTAQVYTVTATHTAATDSLISDGTGSAVLGGTYTNDADQIGVQFKITALNASDVATAAQYSTDGGTTWSAATVAAGAISYNGATISMTADPGNLNKTITVDFHAQYDSLQLTDSATAPVGSAVKVYHGANTATVGDASSSRTIQLNSANLGSLTSTNTVTVQVLTQTSSAATTANGAVIDKAVAVAGIDVSTQAAANTAITTIQNAINTVSTQRSALGAYQNRLQHTINNLSTESQNLTSAESAITDVDMAKEMTNYTKNNILNSAAQAMLAQANQLPQGILQLLK